MTRREAGDATDDLVEWLTAWPADRPSKEMRNYGGMQG